MPSGSVPNTSLEINENRIGSPRPKYWDASVGTGRTSERYKPIMIAGMAKKSPISGPAAPISNKAFLSGIIPFILITAPNVPKGGNGSGRK